MAVAISRHCIHGLPHCLHIMIEETLEGWSVDGTWVKTCPIRPKQYVEHSREGSRGQCRFVVSGFQKRWIRTRIRSFEPPDKPTSERNQRIPIIVGLRVSYDGPQLLMLIMCGRKRNGPGRKFGTCKLAGPKVRRTWPQNIGPCSGLVY
jgi:hypothetical protein